MSWQSITHLYCCCWNTGSLRDRLAKGDRIPLTAQLKPLVVSSADVWTQHSEQDLKDKQVRTDLMYSCLQSSAYVDAAVNRGCNWLMQRLRMQDVTLIEG